MRRIVSTCRDAAMAAFCCFVSLLGWVAIFVACGVVLLLASPLMAIARLKELRAH